jgi:hypothetical protein
VFCRFEHPGTVFKQGFSLKYQLYPAAATL